MTEDVRHEITEMQRESITSLTFGGAVNNTNRKDDDDDDDAFLGWSMALCVAQRPCRRRPPGRMPPTDSPELEGKTEYEDSIPISINNLGTSTCWALNLDAA